MLAGKLFPETPVAHHCFQIADVRQQKVLIDHCAMHILELEKVAGCRNAHPLKISGCCFSRSPALGGIARALEPSGVETGHGHFTAIFRKRTGLPPVPGATERDSGAECSTGVLASPAGSARRGLQKTGRGLRKQEEAIRQRDEERIMKRRSSTQAREEAITELERLKALLKQSGIDPDA